MHKETLTDSAPEGLPTCPFRLTQIFHESFGLPSKERLDSPPSAEDRLRRLRLILEEFEELCEAMGFKLIGDFNLVYRDNDYNKVEVADALGDLNVVVNGTGVEFGIPMPLVNQEIFLSNMSKLGDDGKVILNGVTPGYRDGENGFKYGAPIGKALKGPNYIPPQMTLLIERHDNG